MRRQNQVYIIVSEDKNELQRPCKALCETVNNKYLMTQNEIATMLVEVLQGKQKTIPKSKNAPLLFVTDFEVIAGKEHFQKIIYDIIWQRFVEAKRTIVFSTRNVFDGDTYLHQMQNLFELADKFEI